MSRSLPWHARAKMARQMFESKRRRLKFALACSASILAVVSAARATADEDKGALSASALGGLGSSPFGWGFGLDAGYRWPLGLYLGGESRYQGGAGPFAGEDGSGSRRRSLFALGSEAAFELPPFLGGVLRPAVDCGIGALSGNYASPYVGGSLGELIPINDFRLGYAIELHDYLTARGNSDQTRGVTTVALYLSFGIASTL